jgi:putative membrane protein
MTVTHWPSVVDGLMRTQLGSFALDAAWLAAGVLFWWPLIAPVPERRGFSPLARIGYLALNAFLIRPPFAMMIFSEDPIYRIYELAPPPAGNAMDDQQLGGVIMKIGTAWVLFAGVAVIFLQWVRSEREAAGS